MHPVTPVLNAWKVIVAILVFGAWQMGPDWLEGARDVNPLLVIGAVVLGGALVGGAYSAIAWRMMRYAIDDERVYLESGVLYRRHRQARLDRMQAVDVVQPLVARIVGLAQVTIEQAGGDDSRVALAYLTEAQARELRNELLARAAGITVGAPPEARPADGVEPSDGEAVPGPTPVLARLSAPEAPEHQVFAVPIGRLVGSIAVSGAALGLVLVAVGIVVAAVLASSIAPLGAMFPALLGTVGYVWTRFTNEFDFRAATSPDGIRLRHGLTEARAQTVPPGRVQAVRLTQPFLWRRFGWWRVKVNVAGYGQSDAQKESVLLPVGTHEEALLALWLVLPDLGEPDPRTVLEAGLTGADDEQGFIPSPRRARWLDPIGWRRNGLRVTPRALLLRRGRLERQLDVVPHERTQSLGLAQGPLQRRLGLSSFVAHSTPGPVTPRVAHLDTARAAELIMLQAERARSARAAAPPEKWMRPRP